MRQSVRSTSDREHSQAFHSVYVTNPSSYSPLSPNEDDCNMEAAEGRIDGRPISISSFDFLDTEKNLLDSEYSQQRGGLVSSWGRGGSMNSSGSFQSSPSYLILDSVFDTSDRKISLAISEASFR